jgi:phospholipid transport system substrate-binding protein
MTLPRRRLASLLLAAGILPRAVRADDQRADVRQPIGALYAALEEMMRAGQSVSFRQRFAVIAPVIDRVFDLDTILRVSVGLRWNTIDEASRAALKVAFRRFTIATYVANFDRYDNEKFEIQPDLRALGTDQIVLTRIVPATGDVIRLDYVMHNADNGWRVVDILLDGSISRVAVQRSDFRAILGRGDAAALVESLQRKTADLSGGTLGS